MLLKGETPRWMLIKASLLAAEPYRFCSEFANVVLSEYKTWQNRNKFRKDGVHFVRCALKVRNGPARSGPKLRAGPYLV